MSASAEPQAAKAEMLIRRPVAEVFEAFVDPAITAKFWFTSGSARLETGREVRWAWNMYDFALTVQVREVASNERIVVDWPTGNGTSRVTWTFTALDVGETFVSIVNDRFPGTPQGAVAQAIGATEGFAFVLAGAKAWLEHRIKLELVRDRFPKGLS
jgi:uncharacterized protein YndB with AHSA1/START domain